MNKKMTNPRRRAGRQTRPHPEEAPKAPGREETLPEGGAQEKTKPPRSRLKKWLMGIAITLGALLLLGIGLVALLFGRISKPGTFTFAPEEDEPAITTPAAPAQTPPGGEGAIATQTAPTSVPPATSITPPHADAQNDELEPDEELDPALPELSELPLADVYPQTTLSAAQLAVIQAQNANKADYLHVLLVGVDRRGRSGDSNADTIMIATLDKKHNRLKLTSILRDCYVPIPGVGEGRINSAAAHGGIPLLMETINEMLQLELQDYVLVDFRMFEQIVDKMGGIVVRMTEKEISAANDVIAGLNKQRGVEYLWDGFIFAEPGSVRLTGQQALGYARVRKIDSDFSRTNRQFKVLNAIYAKFRSRNLVQQTALIYDLVPMVETSLGATQIIDIATTALSMDVAGLQHEQVPFDGYYRSGSVNRKSALALDMPMSAWLAHSFMYLYAGEPEEAVLYSGGPSLPPRTPSPTMPPGMLPDGSWPEVQVPEQAEPTPEPPRHAPTLE